MHRARAFLLAALSFAVALGWVKNIHNNAAEQAWLHLPPSTKEFIEGSLLEPSETLREIASWADRYESEIDDKGWIHKWAGPHFFKEGGKLSIINSLKGYWNHLSSGAGGADEDRIVFKFLVHFIQDMHQPLHMTKGNALGCGGNRVLVVLARPDGSTDARTLHGVRIFCFLLAFRFVSFFVL